MATGQSCWRRAGCAAAICYLALVAGCGCGKDLPDRVKVRGKVTLGGGPWPKPGKIYFLPRPPEEEEPSGYPGVGSFDTDGSFVVGSHKENDGLVPGTYGVSVECLDAPPTMDGPPPTNYVPEKYRGPETSEMTLVIEPGSDRQEVTYDIPKQ